MALDVGALERELASLRKQREQVRERLDAGRGGGRGGRGRGMPGPGGRGGRGEAPRGGVFTRLGVNGGPREAAPAGGRASVFDRLYNRSGSGSGAPERPGRDDSEPGPLHRAGSRGAAGRERERDAEPAGASDRPPLMSRLSSRVVVPEGEAPRHSERDMDPDRDRGPGAGAEGGSGSGAPGGGRKRLASAVVVNGEARPLRTAASLDEPGPRDEADEGPPPPKRPAVAIDGKAKRRAARMFGALLVGTLQKFKDEDAAFRQSTTAQRRQELEKRAVERMEAEDARRREEAAAARREEREANLSTLHDINLQADIKALELAYARRLARRQQLAGFCVTQAQPPLYWRPKVVSAEGEAQLAAAAGQFEAWKQQQLEALEADKAGLVERAEARRAAALARRAGGAGGAGQQQDEGGEDAGEQADGDGRDDEMRDDEQQAADEDEEQQEAAAASGGEAEPQEQEQEPEQAERRQRKPKQRRQLASDEEEEERLLSSDDEEEEDD